MKFFSICILGLLFSGCLILEEAGINPNDDLSGKEAKKQISESIRNAESQALSFWLAQNGMGGGINSAIPLIAVNGYLASIFYPYISKIEDKSYYKNKSVQDCKEAIETKGALLLGVSYNSLPPAGIAAPARDAYLLENFSACELTKAGSLLSIPKVIDL